MKLAKKYTTTILTVLTVASLVYLVVTDERWNDQPESDPQDHILNERNKRNGELTSFVGRFLLVMSHAGVCCAVVYVPLSLVVTCWERVDILALVCGALP